jgi:cardiolipin synthase
VSRAPDWREGNRAKLLENGEEFYPALYERIGRARQEVLIETFILFEDRVGHELRDVLIAAGKRGVHVVLTVDGYGSANLTPGFVGPMADAGVELRIFDPRQKIFGMRTNLFRRLHRKLAVIDRNVAFVGGINFAEDHLRDHGPESKQDYMVEVEGPVVADIHELMSDVAGPESRAELPRRPSSASVGSVRAILATRDNHRHREDIEWHYREAIRGARKEIIIANAYFFPGFRLVRSMVNAARRGVTVKLILQGRPDWPLIQWAATTLYDHLLHAGVRIYEYCERPMHSKVAVIDGQWSTVGSSNLDPLSLYLNLEANLIMLDADFARDLSGKLETLVEHHCKEMRREHARPRTLSRQILSWLVFHLTRRFPAWFGWLPAHTTRRALLVKPETLVAGKAVPAEKEEEAA